MAQQNTHDVDHVVLIFIVSLSFRNSFMFENETFLCVDNWE